MAAYEDASKEVYEKLNSYIKRGEKLKLSKSIEINGEEYRELLFYKKSLLKLQITAILYIDSKEEVVKNKVTLKELVKRASYYEVLFGDINNKSILSAIKEEGALKREKRDFEICLEALAYLEKESIKEVLPVKAVIDKLPSLRKINNDRLIELQSVLVDEQGLRDDAFYKLRTTYLQVLEENYQAIKLIVDGMSYYDNLKSIVVKKRRNPMIRFNRKISEPLFKLEYQLSYFKRFLNTYSSVIGLSAFQYRKYIENTEKNNIHLRIKLIREKIE